MDLLPMIFDRVSKQINLRVSTKDLFDKVSDILKRMNYFDDIESLRIYNFIESCYENYEKKINNK